MKTSRLQSFCVYSGCFWVSRSLFWVFPGLSDEILAPGFPPEDTSSTYTEDGFCDSRTNEVLQSTLEDDNDGLDRKLEVFDGLEDGSIKDSASILDSLVVPKNVVITKEIEGPEYLELDNLFSEDASSSAISFPDVLKSQKKMKPSQSVYGSMLGKVDDIWRKVLIFGIADNVISFLLLISS